MSESFDLQTALPLRCTPKPDSTELDAFRFGRVTIPHTMTLPLGLNQLPNSVDVYIDARTQGYQGPSRGVRLVRATPSGGGAIARNEDGSRCAVTGKESLRIIRVYDSSQTQPGEHKFAVGPGGHRLEASRNLWESSGLKIDCASTDVAWGHKQFDNKILTSARNGELIMWDLNKAGPTKYERRAKDHIRSINKISVSHVVENYCITGSADGYMRVWDMRVLNTSIMRIHHPTSVRTLVFSPSLWLPLQAIVGLDNGSIIRWDLRVGQRGQLDKLAVAHSASVTTLDWRGNTAGPPTNQSSSELAGNGLGWIVSGGLDRCVKIWDLTAPGSNTRISPKPTYTLHPSFPVRRVLWRPSYECEIALVSNTEFATKSGHELTQNMIISGNLSGTLSRVGSSYNLESLPVRSLSALGRQPSETFQQTTSLTDPPSASTTGAGDAVEIWDVRRGWIAKWAIPGSSVEGGVTDVAFRDSHSLWAQHSSGTFSQVDLRETVKPLDAIPRSAVSWDASGSLAFVADRAVPWEMPYDDAPLEHVEDRKSRSKALGDSPHRPETQSVGTFVGHAFIDNLESFVKLACGYIVQGKDRSAVCISNAQVAFRASREDLAQMWLLMAASLTECVPTIEPIVVQTEPPEKHLLIPAAPSNYVFPSASQSEQTPSLLQRTSPNVPPSDSTHRLPQKGSTTSTPRGLTPTSSTASSPRLVSGNLPSIAPRRASIFTRRESVDSSMTRISSSLYRRPSLPNAGMHGSSPSNKANPSLRHVGEGVLDDSDSSGEGDDTKEIIEEASSEEDREVSPLTTSPRVHILKSVGAPSPLSQILKQQGWTEDEGGENNDDDEASPSPGSTDTESSGDDLVPRRPRSAKSRRDSFRVKSRSRSSTVASLAAPKVPHILAHQESFSSIRTVTAGEVSFKEDPFNISMIKGDEPSREPPSAHIRQKSQALSDLSLGFVGREPIHEEVVEPRGITERRPDIVWEEEQRIKELGWEALRAAMEELADQGDVQTCAMMSILAPIELRLREQRIIRFLETYIDTLSRLKLFSAASYIRKFSNVQAIQNPTTLQTTIYTACGMCRKPLLIPAATYLPGEVFKGGYAFCLSCKTTASVCAICRLPVKGLLFECPVCTHGGHQACYREYYGRRPMVTLPQPTLSRLPLQEDEIPSSRDDETSTVSSCTGTIDPLNVSSAHRKTIVGHLCPTGCGHYCSIVSDGDV